MKLLSTFCILLALALGAPDRAVAKGPDLTLKQIMANSSRVKALAVIRNSAKNKPTPTQFRILIRNADIMRKILRARTALQSEDQIWAALIEPQNRCTDLVRKVCGVQKQCADASTCGLAVQVLEIYNNKPTADEKYEFEGQCIISLDDNIIFPACE